MAKEEYPAGGRNRTPRVRRVAAVSEFGDSREREERARRTAGKWRVLQKLGDGVNYYMETDNMDWALSLAQVLLGAFNGRGVMVQAVADDGATGDILPEQFELYKKAWRQRGTHQDQTTRPSEARAGEAPADDKAGRSGGGPTRRERPRRA